MAPRTPEEQEFRRAVDNTHLRPGLFNLIHEMTGEVLNETPLSAQDLLEFDIALDVRVDLTRVEPVDIN